MFFLESFWRCFFLGLRILRAFPGVLGFCFDNVSGFPGLRDFVSFPWLFRSEFWFCCGLIWALEVSVLVVWFIVGLWVL